MSPRGFFWTNVLQFGIWTAFLATGVLCWSPEGPARTFRGSGNACLAAQLIASQPHHLRDADATLDKLDTASCLVRASKEMHNLSWSRFNIFHLTVHRCLSLDVLGLSMFGIFNI